MSGHQTSDFATNQFKHTPYAPKGAFGAGVQSDDDSCSMVGGVADYLVTGGAGFIGSALVIRIRRRYPSAVIKVIDNLWRGNLENLRMETDFAIDIAQHFHNVDLMDYEQSARIIRCSRTLYHLADIVAGIDFVFANQAFVFRQNVLINSNTLAAVLSARSRVENYIYVGTACSFPKHLQMSYTVSALLENQTYPANPESSYGWSKLMGEYEASLQRNRQDNHLNITLLRFHNVFGPRMIHGAGAQAISALIFKAINLETTGVGPHVFDVFGSGKQYRDFVFVDDIVHALMLAPSAYGQGVVQIGTGCAVTVDSLAYMIARMVDHAFQKKISPRFLPRGLEGDRGRVADTHRAENIMGWRPSTLFETGLALTFNRIATDMLHQHNQSSSAVFPAVSEHMLARVREWDKRVREFPEESVQGLTAAALGTGQHDSKVPDGVKK